MIRILLEKGLNVNNAEEETQTPLAIIAKKHFYHTEQFIKDALPFGRLSESGNSTLWTTSTEHWLSS